MGRDRGRPGDAGDRRPAGQAGHLRQTTRAVRDRRVHPLAAARGSRRRRPDRAPPRRHRGLRVAPAGLAAGAPCRVRQAGRQGRARSPGSSRRTARPAGRRAPRRCPWRTAGSSRPVSPSQRTPRAISTDGIAPPWLQTTVTPGASGGRAAARRRPGRPPGRRRTPPRRARAAAASVEAQALGERARRSAGSASASAVRHRRRPEQRQHLGQPAGLVAALARPAGAGRRGRPSPTGCRRWRAAPAAASARAGRRSRARSASTARSWSWVHQGGGVVDGQPAQLVDLVVGRERRPRRPASPSSRPAWVALGHRRSRCARCAGPTTTVEAGLLGRPRGPPSPAGARRRPACPWAATSRRTSAGAPPPSRAPPSSPGARATPPAARDHGRVALSQRAHPTSRQQLGLVVAVARCGVQLAVAAELPAADVRGHRRVAACACSCVRAVSSHTRSSTSTRRSRLRCMRSALPSHHSGSPSLSKDMTRRVLEEAADDRAHPDGLRQPGHAGAQRADAADQQLDRHAGLRGLVQRVDDLLVDQRVRP